VALSCGLRQGDRSACGPPHGRPCRRSRRAGERRTARRLLLVSSISSISSRTGMSGNLAILQHFYPRRAFAVSVAYRLVSARLQYMRGCQLALGKRAVYTARQESACSGSQPHTIAASHRSRRARANCADSTRPEWSYGVAASVRCDSFSCSGSHQVRATLGGAPTPTASPTLSATCQALKNRLTIPL
jgi:hypothetical protein